MDSLKSKNSPRKVCYLCHSFNSVVLVGAGYIAVELAGIFNALGTETHMIIRHKYVLRNFDSLLHEGATNEIISSGIKLHTQSFVKEVTQQANGKKKVALENGTTLEDVDILLWTIGRSASINCTSYC